MTTRYAARRSGGARVRETAPAEQRVGIRELKARLSEWVRVVKEGGTVVVTEHGRPVARLVPEPASARERMLAMARTGEITWNGQPFTRRGPVARPRGPRTLADLIIEDRDER
jgi:prevent-host-death family protein